MSYHFDVQCEKLQGGEGMAHIEIWYRCPTCRVLYSNQNEAFKCRNSHPVIAEKWAVGKGGKAVKINEFASPDGMYGVNWALREADLSDFIEEREKQLRNENSE